MVHCFVNLLYHPILVTLPICNTKQLKGNEISFPGTGERVT